MSLTSSRTAMLAAAMVAIGGGVPRPARAVDGAIQNPANGHWYAYAPASPMVSWATAKDAAAALGGYLATITSSAEQQWVVQNLSIATRPQCWLGGTDAAVEGTWAWTNGDAWSYSNWASGEPNNLAGIEDLLMMYPNGTWNDTSDDHTNAGYVVEWDTDPNAPPAPPSAPINLSAAYSPLDGVTLTWTDAGANEDGFRVERHPAGYAYSLRATTAANEVSYVDAILFPSTTYTYRVRAFNAGGDSAYSNEVSITTVAGPTIPPLPRAPETLTAAVDAPVIALEWTDRSVDETLFGLERALSGGTFATLVTAPADATAHADAAVHPGWPYTYRVRALSLQGPSPYSNKAAATVPATLDVTLAGGSLADSGKFRRDKLKFAGGFVVAASAAGTEFDPVAQGLEIRAGATNALAAISIAPGDTTWKSRKGRLSWKSPKAAAVKASVVIDTLRGLVTVKASGLEFTAAPSTTVELLLASGPLGGAASTTWVEHKPGSLRPE